jgi:hypothetical protein
MKILLTISIFAISCTSLANDTECGKVIGITVEIAGNSFEGKACTKVSTDNPNMNIKCLWPSVVPLATLAITSQKKFCYKSVAKVGEAEDIIYSLK